MQRALALYCYNIGRIVFSGPVRLNYLHYLHTRMDNSLRHHPLISVLFRSIGEFRKGALDLAGLQQNFSAVMGAIEGDVPKAVREAIYQLESDLDSIRFTVGDAEQALEVEKAIIELENLIDNYDG
jgi:hypothetical protein